MTTNKIYNTKYYNIDLFDECVAIKSHDNQKVTFTHASEIDQVFDDHSHLLITYKDGFCVYVGRECYSFDSNDQIISFHVVTEEETGQLLHYAIGIKNTYLLTEYQSIKNSDLEKFKVDGTYPDHYGPYGPYGPYFNDDELESTEIPVDMILEHQKHEHTSLCEKYGPLIIIASTCLLLGMVVYLGPTEL